MRATVVAAPTTVQATPSTITVREISPQGTRDLTYRYEGSAVSSRSATPTPTATLGDSGRGTLRSTTPPVVRHIVAASTARSPQALSPRAVVVQREAPMGYPGQTSPRTAPFSVPGPTSRFQPVVSTAVPAGHMMADRAQPSAVQQASTQPVRIASPPLSPRLATPPRSPRSTMAGNVPGRLPTVVAPAPVVITGPPTVLAPVHVTPVPLGSGDDGTAEPAPPSRRLVATSRDSPSAHFGAALPFDVAEACAWDVCGDLAVATAGVSSAAVAEAEAVDAPAKQPGITTLLEWQALADLRHIQQDQVLYGDTRTMPPSLSSLTPRSDVRAAPSSLAAQEKANGRAMSPNPEKRFAALEARCLELEKNLKGKDDQLRELQEISTRTARELERKERQVEETSFRCSTLTQKLEQSETESLAITRRAQELELEVQRLAQLQRDLRLGADDSPRFYSSSPGYRAEDSPPRNRAREDSDFGRQVREVNAGRRRNEVPVPVVEANLISNVGDYRDLPTLAALRSRLYDHKDAHGDRGDRGEGGGRNGTTTPRRAARTPSSTSTASHTQRMGSKDSRHAEPPASARRSKRPAQDNVWR